MLYSPSVGKKLDVATLTKSRSSNKSTSSETFSLVSTQSSDDDRRSNRSQQLCQTKNFNRVAKPSKSETATSSSSQNNGHKAASFFQPLTFRTKRSTTLSNESSVIKSPYKSIKEDIVVEEEDEEEGEGEGEGGQYQKIASKLKTTFMDIIESSPLNQKSKTSDDDIMDLVRSQFDAQSVRIRRLERALREKEDQLIKGDNEDTISLLLARYPQSMEIYRKQIEEDQFNQQLETCIEQFELQKQRMIEEHQRNFEVLKSKYRSRFDDIVERMITDPSRLDDEWARRVKKEADDRIEEMRRKYAKK